MTVEGGTPEGTGGAATPVTPSQPNVAAQTVPYAEYQRLQSQYAGLQGHIQNELTPKLTAAQKREQELAQQYEGRLTEAAGQVASLSRETELHKTSAAQFQKERDELARKAAALEAQSTVRAKIAKDFPGLTQAHDTGLLRTEGLEGEGLDNYLKNFAAFAGQQQQAGVARLLDGAAAPSVAGVQPGSIGMNSAQMMDKLMTMTPGTPDYIALSNEYYSALAAQK